MRQNALTDDDDHKELSDPITQVNLQLVALEHLVVRLLVMNAPSDHEDWMERLRAISHRDVAMWSAPNLSEDQNAAARRIIDGHIDRLTRGVIDLSVKH